MFTYNGDDNYNPNTVGATVSQTVDEASTGTSLTSTTLTSVSGQSVSFTVWVNSDAPGAGVPTGEVTLTDTTTDTTYGPLTLANGSATFTMSGLGVGSHSFTANYLGDDVAGYLASTSNIQVQTVATADTTINVSSTANPGTSGTSVTLTAVVKANAPGSGTPGGMLEYTIDGVTTSANLVDGVATIVLSDLPAGTLPIAFSYGGDPDFNAATANFTEVMGTSAATATLTPSSTSVAYGQAGTYVVTLTGIDGLAPTGTVQLDVAGAFYAQAYLVAGEGAVSTASFSVNGLVPATYTLQAIYGGDSSYQSAQSATASLTVAAATTQVTGFASSVAATTPGTPVSLSAQVSVTDGAGTPTGMMLFEDVTDPSNPIVLGRVNLLNGQAILNNVSFPSTGTRDLLAIYQPQGPDFAGSSASTSVVVNVVSTNLQLITPTIAYSQSSVTLTAMVGGAGSVTTGTIDFYDNGNLVGSVPLNGSNVATLSLTDLPQGNNAFTATYTDSTGATYGSSTSGVTMTSVVPNPLTPITVATTITVTPIYLPPPSSVPANLGGRNTRLKFQVQLVNPIPNVPTPTGTVTVYANGKPIGTYNLNADGTATIVLHGKAAYNKSIVVTYNGNIQGITTYAPSSSTPFLADKAYFYGNSPENSSSSHVKRGVHPAGPAKFSHGGHKTRVQGFSVHHTTKVHFPRHHKLS